MGGGTNPYGVLSEDEILKKLEKAREHAEQGMYRNAEDEFEFDEVVKCLNYINLLLMTCGLRKK